MKLTVCTSTVELTNKSKYMELFKLFDMKIRDKLLKLSGNEISNLEEIRIRVNQPLICLTKGQEIGVSNIGRCAVENAHIVTVDEIKNTIKLMSNFSLYTIEDQIKKGFFTVSGGHRVGVCGKAVIENGEIKTLKDISSLNVRISREVKGCSDELMCFVVDKDKKQVRNTLIISPPNNGKTTLLRDLVRNISNSGYNLVVVDERSEIGGTYNGELQNDLGVRCDVLDACEKTVGMTMALRSMAPRVIVVDEIGTDEDIKALIKTFNSGVNIVATCHADSVEQFRQKQSFQRIIEEGLFEVYVLLRDKKVVGVFDREFKGVCETEITHKA